MTGGWRTAIAVLSLCACGSAAVAPNEPNPLRRELERDLAHIDATQALELRFNPAPCNCPGFELRVGERWVRAEINRSEGDMVTIWLAWLAQTPIEALPVPVSLLGRVEREILRTAQGSYAVRIDVREIVAPKAPAVSELPEAAPEPPSPTP